MRITTYNPNPDLAIRSLLNGQPDILEITTATVPGQEMEIAHGLGRIPNGYEVISRPSWLNVWHESTDTEWTDRFIYLKFSHSEKAITLAVW